MNQKKWISAFVCLSMMASMYPAAGAVDANDSKEAVIAEQTVVQEDASAQEEDVAQEDEAANRDIEQSETITQAAKAADTCTITMTPVDAQYTGCSYTVNYGKNGENEVTNDSNTVDNGTEITVIPIVQGGNNFRVDTVYYTFANGEKKEMQCNSDPDKSDYDNFYKLTVTEDVTIEVTFAPFELSEKEQNQVDVDVVKTIFSQANWVFDIEDTSDENVIKEQIQAKVNELIKDTYDQRGVSATVTNITVDTNSTSGSFELSVALSKGDGENKIEETFTINDGVINLYSILTFNANGGVFGNGEESVVRKLKDNKLILSSDIPIPSRTGYRFAGWHTEKDDGKGEKVEDFTKELPQVKTLYAHWEKLEENTSITIGEPSISPLYGESCTVTFSVTVKEGMTGAPTFRWSGGSAPMGLTADIGQTDDGYLVTVTSDGTVQAGTYSFSLFYDTDAQPANASLTIRKAPAPESVRKMDIVVSTDGETVSEVIPMLPESASYGYPTASGDLEIVFSSLSGEYLEFITSESTTGQTGTIIVPVTHLTNYEDYDLVVTVTAVDAPATHTAYTITCDANGGKLYQNINGSAEDTYRILTVSTTEHSKKLLSKLPTPKRDGYQFIGWFFADGKTEADYDTTFTSNTTLYAKWENIMVPVDADVDKNVENDTVQTTVKKDNLGVNDTTQNAELTIDATDNSAAGKAATTATVTLPNDVLTALAGKSQEDSRENKVDAVSINTNFGTVTVNNAVLEQLAAEAATTGKSVEFKVVAQDKENAKLPETAGVAENSEIYSIGFWMDGEEIAIDDTSYSIEMDLDFSNYTDKFDNMTIGWTNSKGSGTLDAKDVTFANGHAKFTLTHLTQVYLTQAETPAPTSEHTITFNANGGTVNGSATLYTDESGTLSGQTLPTATRSGFTFQGWILKDSTEVTTDTAFTSDTTLYAKWEKTASESDVTVEKKVEVDKDGKVTASMNVNDLAGLAKDAVEATVEITVHANNAENPTSAAVNLPADVLNILTGKTGEKDRVYYLTVNTPVGTVTVNVDVLRAVVAEAAKDATVTLNVVSANEIANLPQTAAPIAENSEIYSIYFASDGKELPVEEDDMFIVDLDLAFNLPDDQTIAWVSEKYHGVFHTEEEEFQSGIYSYDKITGRANLSMRHLSSFYRTAAYQITVDKNIPHGSITKVLPGTAAEGESVSVFAEPESGYTLSKIIVTPVDESVGSVTVETNNDNGLFTMPACDVTVSAIFKEVNSNVKPAQPGGNGGSSNSGSSSGSSGGSHSSSGGSHSGGGSSSSKKNNNNSSSGTTTPKITIPSITSRFTDISTSAYYVGAVEWAVNKGITNGTSATAFNPNGSCTRAQIVTFLWRAAGSPEPQAASSSFKDVSSSAYYAKAVQWAVEQGITSGKSATQFDPSGVCTRAQAVTFLYRANGSPAVSGTASFGDVTSGAYFEKAVQWAVNKGITNGTSAASFTPHNNCTRAQIVTFLYRAQQ